MGDNYYHVALLTSNMYKFLIIYKDSLMFSRPNHHQRRQQNDSPCPVRESAHLRASKTTQPSMGNDLVNEPAHDTESVQDKKLSHTKPEVRATDRTPQQLPSPPETPGSGTPMPTHVYLQPTGASTVTREACLLELLLESALAALVAIRSTPNSTPTLSQIAKTTLAKLNKLAEAETEADATVHEIAKNADTQTPPRNLREYKPNTPT